MELHGKVALVTGGGSGIGQSTARRLAAEGMQVCVVDVDGAAAHMTAEEIGGLAVPADVSDSAQVDAAFAACVAAFGTVDLAFLNAGVSGGILDLATTSDADYTRIRGVNQDGVVFGARAMVRTVRERIGGGTGGVIIATSSLAGIDPLPPNPIYTLTKHAVVGLIRALAPALALDRITAHAICPTVTDTAMLSESRKPVFAAMGIIPVPPDRVAEAVIMAATSGPEKSGTCWTVLSDATLPHRFTEVAGPHTALNAIRPPSEVARQ
jgi:NAD(P)-dependent dehydrogenase (short-subunit alcohol dehydrogenase family)